MKITKRSFKISKESKEFYKKVSSNRKKKTHVCVLCVTVNHPHIEYVSKLNADRNLELCTIARRVMLKQIIPINSVRQIFLIFINDLLIFCEFPCKIIIVILLKIIILFHSTNTPNQSVPEIKHILKMF